MAKQYLMDLAEVLRSKNAGPFNLTFDIILKNDKVYRYIKENDLINGTILAKKYGIDDSQVVVFEFVDWISAFKFTIRRPMVSGDPGEPDVYGCQQHAPLLDLELDIPDSVMQ